MNHEQLAQPDVVAAWVHGWTLARGTAAPVALDNGHRVDVGLPGHLMRYVLPRFEPLALQRLAQTLTAPGIWLKVCAQRERVAAMLSPAWTVHDPEYLMTTPLRRIEMDASAPSGYQSALSALGAVADAKVVATDGQLAASGRVTLHGTYAVIDQVVTDAAHRRRGLGSVVMNLLCQHAAAHGADTGVLVATEDGLALYRRLGWALHAPVTAAVIAA